MALPEADDRAQQPSPDALLETAGREHRGRLKIFLGAAPGVGKTYEMLQAARARRAEGVDVVIGVLETHGRKETEALMAGLGGIPRRRTQDKGRVLEEMGIDAVLAPRPKPLLLDELPPTNSPRSPAPKTYLQLEE